MRVGMKNTLNQPILKENFSLKNYFQHKTRKIFFQTNTSKIYKKLETQKGFSQEKP